MNLFHHSLRGWVKKGGHISHPPGCDNIWHFNFNLGDFRTMTKVEKNPSSDITYGIHAYTTNHIYRYRCVVYAMLYTITTQNPGVESRNMGHLATMLIYDGEQNTGSMGQNQNAVTTFSFYVNSSPQGPRRPATYATAPTRRTYVVPASSSRVTLGPPLFYEGRKSRATRATTRTTFNRDSFV